MSFDLAGMKANIATVAATITAGGVAMAGASSTNLDSLNETPWTVVKNPKGTLSAGNFEMVMFDLPVTIYLGRLADAGRNDTLAIPFLNAFLEAFRTHVTLGGSAPIAASGPLCTQALVRDFDLDVYYDIAGETYQAIDLTFAIIVAGQGTQYTVG